MTIVRRDDLYDLPMRNAFIRLLTHLWIDVRLISLQLPDRIRVWKEMEESTKMIQTDNDTKKYFPLQTFVQSYLHNIT